MLVIPEGEANVQLPKSAVTDCRLSWTRAEMRFISKVLPVDSGCWEWQGAALKGRCLPYGVFKSGGVQLRAHRFMYRLACGKDPAGLFVCHSCDNPRCVNPAHLYLGTAADNAADRSRRGRSAKGDRSPYRLNPGSYGGSRSGPVKHPERYRGENNGRARLNSLTVRRILERHQGGETQASLAKIYGVAPSTVSGIAQGRLWREVWECWSSLKETPTCSYRKVL